MEDKFLLSEKKNNFENNSSSNVFNKENNFKYDINPIVNQVNDNKIEKKKVSIPSPRHCPPTNRLMNLAFPFLNLIKSIFS